jgi:ferredoxin-NADP reductase
MPVTWYKATIQKIESLAPGVRSFQLQVPELESFVFEAGQFVTFDLPIGDKRLQRWRSYSIANAPDASNIFELCVVRSEQGQGGSKYLFDEVEVGSELTFKGPDGGFVLPATIDKDLVFVCTGTGIAPFRSMIHDLHRSGKPHRNIHLIFGAREAADVLYREEWEELTRTMPGFTFDVALSRQPDWAGWKGYVHQVYQSQYQTPRPDVAFYLCGWSKMIDEAVANLILQMGFDRTQVHYELYG